MRSLTGAHSRKRPSQQSDDHFFDFPRWSLTRALTVPGNLDNDSMVTIKVREEIGISSRYAKYVYFILIILTQGNVNSVIVS